MVDLSVASAAGIVLAFIVGEAPVLYYALQTPTSSPREILAYVVITALGVGHLLVQGA